MPTILNTRPIRQAKRMETHFSKHEINVINIPLVDIVKNEKEQEKLKLCETQKVHILIFTSANAVWNSADYIKEIIPGTSIIAVGPATKRELESIGASKILMPDEYNTKSILEMSLLNDKKQKKIIVITGAEPIINLDEELKVKGHDVNSYYVYKREINKNAKKKIEKIKNIDAVLIGSAQCLEIFKNILDMSDHKELIKIKMFVISTKVQKLAIKLGFYDTVYVIPIKGENLDIDYICRKLGKGENK